jgi:hypothetical protein
MKQASEHTYCTCIIHSIEEIVKGDWIGYKVRRLAYVCQFILRYADRVQVLLSIQRLAGIRFPRNPTQSLIFISGENVLWIRR